MTVTTKIPIFDGHNDTLLKLFPVKREGGRSFFVQSDQGHLDLPRAREGGFGGESGPPAGNKAPERGPDLTVESKTMPNQALIYRLSGDKNPLHADPQFAKMGGFDKPILHGLSSFGVVCKAVVDNVLDGDVTKVARYQVRFAGVVFPGETIVTSVWREGDRLLLTAKTKERDTPVVSNAAIELRS